MVKTLIHGEDVDTNQVHKPTKTLAYATSGATAPLAPFNLERREPGPHDIQIEILYCGICHSDIHTARNEWKNTIYPCVPGHEIVGRVAKVGNEVKGFKVGWLHGGLLPHLFQLQR